MAENEYNFLDPNWGKFLSTPINKQNNMGFGFLPQGGAEAALNGIPLQSVPAANLTMDDWWKGINLHGTNTDGVGHITGTTTPGLPDAKGGWMDYGKMGLGALQVGTGIWNASLQNDQNKFMRQTTNEQMARQKTDFNNSVLAYNNEASAREGRRISGAQGIAYDDPRNVAGRADYMKTWGASNIA